MPTLPPGPSEPPLVQTFRYLRRPFAFLDECAERYGDKFTLRFFRLPPFVNFNDPDVVKDIFAASPDVVRAGEANTALEFALIARRHMHMYGTKPDANPYAPAPSRASLIGPWNVTPRPAFASSV